MASIDGPQYPGIEDGLIFCFDPKNRDCWKGGTTSYSVSPIGTTTGTLNNDLSSAEVAYALTDKGYFLYDGTDDSINTGTSPLYTQNVTTFTVSCWINVNDVSTDMNNSVGVILADSPGADPTGGGFWLGYDDRTSQSITEGIQYNIKTNAGYQRGTSSNNAISSDTWYNVVLVLDTQAYLYFNGVLDTNRTTDNDGTFTRRSDDLFISSEDTLSYEFKGSIGPVLCYNRGLSAAEVMTNYNRLKGRFGL
jgi:hypothetical protein